MSSLSQDRQKALIAAARDGDRSALGELLESYRVYLMLMARVEIDPRLRAKVAPSDVVQDTFVHAERGFADFRGDNEAQLVGWLRRILANQLAMHIRSFTTQRRDIHLEVRLEDSLNRSSQALAACIIDSGSSPSCRVEKREQAVVVANALASLPSVVRQVLILRHVENHTFPDIARRMDRPLENVKSLWRRGIIQLRNAVLGKSTE
jgi:RNA polymerase sigma-70 factor (ECF subfamily)